MFFSSKSLILGVLLRLHISRQSGLVSLNCSHSNIKCLIVRIALLQSSQWGATSGTASLIRYPSANKCTILTLFITTSSLRVYLSLSVQIPGTISLNLSLQVSHRCIHLSTSAFLITLRQSVRSVFLVSQKLILLQYLPTHFLLYQHVMEPSIHL